MKLFTVITACSLLGLTAAAPTADKPSLGKQLATRQTTKGIEKRQGDGTDIFLTILSSLFQNIFPAPPACDSYFEEGQQYYIKTGQAPNGLYWSVCYANSTNLVEFGQAEVDVANCLTNLHYVQADTCISVAGSLCDNGYIAGGGRLQQLSEPIIGSGTQSDAQISADASSALQDAIASMNGVYVDGLDYVGPYFMLNHDSTFTQVLTAQDQMQVNWIGEDTC